MSNHLYCEPFSREDIEFLIDRQLISLEKLTELSDFLNGKSLFISGAAGSVGSHLIEALIPYKPSKIIALDHSEKALFELSLRFSNKDIPLEYHLGDICDREALDHIFSSFSPEIVFHAAAYKHVFFMEKYPQEAFKNNILGTKNLADLARAYRVKNFIFISTDKAVHPSSVMGASKRWGELYVSSLNQPGHSDSRFIITRFGNVFHSNGSVLSIFLHQLINNKALTITHPEAERFFLTMPEAAFLILKSLLYSLKSPAGLYILKTGSPVRMALLARRLACWFEKKSHSEKEISFIGLKKGEKIREDTHYQEEILQDTDEPFIFQSELSSKVRKNIPLAYKEWQALKNSKISLNKLSVLSGNADSRASLIF